MIASAVSIVRFASLAIAVGGLACAASPADARTVSIGGTHSKQEINSKCDAAGGVSITGAGGKGYGCFNPNKQTVVACNNGGECTGYVPLRAKPSNNNKHPGTGLVAH